MSVSWGCPLNLPAYAFFATGDMKYARYLNSALWPEGRNLRYNAGSLLEGALRGAPSSLDHYYMQRVCYALEALRRAPTDPGLDESRWDIHPKLLPNGKPGPMIDFWVLDEDDQPIRLLVFGRLFKPDFRIIATAPDGVEALRQEFKANLHMPHGASWSVPHCYQTIPSDGKKGVYRVVVESLDGSNFVLRAPFSEKNKEVYPISQVGTVNSRGRVHFELPKDSGAYTVAIIGQKGGLYPARLYDDQNHVLAEGAVERRSDGNLVHGNFPVTIDSSKRQRYYVETIPIVGTSFSIEGKQPPKYMATSFDRLFDPEQAGKR
jgi:hypothetical protein